MANVKSPTAAPVLYGQPQARPLGAAPVLYGGSPDQARAGTLTNTMAAPPDPSRAGSLSSGMTLPAPVPIGPNTVPPYTPPSPQTFGGQAPTPTPYGDFTAPDPLTFTKDPSYQFRLNEGLKQQQRGAAARGSLLTGGFQKALLGYGQGLASEEYGNAYNRALQGYEANRATNAQNFGQGMEQFQGNLAGFNANTNAALGYGRLGLESQGQQYGQGRQGALDQQSNQQSQNDYNAAQSNLAQQAADEQYARQVAATRAQNEAASAAQRLPLSVPSQRRLTLAGRR